MTHAFSNVWSIAMLFAALPGVAVAASPTKPAKEAAKVVELFAGMKSGEIEVKVFPKDSTEGTVTIKNKSGKPLTIQVPAALAGVPVLAQAFGGDDLGGGLGGGGNNNGGGNQGFGGGMMGGGMGGMGGMMGGMGGMGGMFNVAPEKVAKIKLVTVCLDHGKADPNPRIPYQLVPVESYAKNAEVTEVLKLMVQGKLDQHSAQAAAWHLQNGLTWEELATKIGAKHLSGSIEPYFTSAHLERALAATQLAQERAEALRGTSPAHQPVQSLGKDLARQN